MKPCSYCGRDNADNAVQCRECGTEFEVTIEPALPEPKRPGFDFPPLSAADKARNLVTLVNCRTLIEADLIVCNLEAAGIEAFVPDQYLMQAVGWNFNTYGYVRVQVAPKDYDAAKDLLTGNDSDV